MRTYQTTVFALVAAITYGAAVATARPYVSLRENDVTGLCGSTKSYTGKIASVINNGKLWGKGKNLEWDVCQRSIK